MKIHFRPVKNFVARPLHHIGSIVTGLPPAVGRTIMRSIGTCARAGYFMPHSHLSRTVENFCIAVGRSDPWSTFSGMVDNIEHASLQFARLHRYGRAELLEQTIIEPTLEVELQRLSAAKQGAIILVPHCAGAVLSSARLSTVCPTVLLVREPKDPGRCELLMEYMQKLGPEFILARNTPPAQVFRSIVRALHDGKVVVGTTDLVKADADTIETRAFGQRIHSPSWPARISARLNVPILPGYIHMDQGRITLFGDKPYLEEDTRRATQRWVSSFEQRFRLYPSDWVFMLDKNWARILEAAAASAGEAMAQKAQRQPSFTTDQRTSPGK